MEGAGIVVDGGKGVVLVVVLGVSCVVLVLLSDGVWLVMMIVGVVGDVSVGVVFFLFWLFSWCFFVTVGCDAGVGVGTVSVGVGIFSWLFFWFFSVDM